MECERKAENKNSYRVETRLKHLHVSWHVLGEKFPRNLAVMEEISSFEFKFERSSKGLGVNSVEESSWPDTGKKKTV